MTAFPLIRRARPGAARGTKGAGRQLAAGPWTYAVLSVVALLSVVPLYWTLVAASRNNAEIASTPPPFVPGNSLFDNIGHAMETVDMVKALRNSLIVSGSIALGTVFMCTMAGFAFAKLRFRGNRVLLGITIGTMMIPSQLGVIPLFMLIAKLHWVNHLQAVILPTLVSAFGVFFMRQFLSEAMPDELLEAAWVDGAGTWRIFTAIVLPIARPAMAVLGMLTFLTAWNDFFWPIIALTSDNPTVQVALNNLGGGYVPDQSVIMAGTLVGTVPVLVVFAILGKHIVGGIMQGAVKG
ncbi:MAG TPA: carbohydrate ABC transporter permease [Dermatophilaceae bacterium]|nr:carbohydrate ABC transporter permease [Dermatophilaceae bacterium]